MMARSPPSGFVRANQGRSSCDSLSRAPSGALARSARLRGRCSPLKARRRPDAGSADRAVWPSSAPEVCRATIMPGPRGCDPRGPTSWLGQPRLFLSQPGPLLSQLRAHRLLSRLGRLGRDLGEPFTVAFFPVAPVLLRLAQHLLIFRFHLITMGGDVRERARDLPLTEAEPVADEVRRPLVLEILQDTVEGDPRPGDGQPHIRPSDHYRLGCAHAVPPSSPAASGAARRTPSVSRRYSQSNS